MGCCSDKKAEDKKKKGNFLKVDRRSEHLRKLSSAQLEAKIVLLGDSAVGKTSLVLRYVDDEFKQDPKVTLGGAYSKKCVSLSSGETIKLHIWDTGGSEEAKSMVPLYYRKAKAGLITFDLSNAESFHDYWADEISTALEPGTFKMFLVGNKCDLEKRAVSTKDALEFAKKHNMEYFETSTKTGQGVNELFLSVAECVSQLDDPTVG